MIEKKWVFIGIGVFIVVVGMVSWGVATDWKFFGDNSNKSGGGSEPTPPSQPTDNCEGKCKENEICCQSLRDGTTKKCCPNTMSDPVFDGDKCCSRNNIVDGECCDNPSKNTILSTSFFKNTYGKQCCDSKTFDKSDSNGCYELCGDNTTKCYQLKGEYCGKDSGDGKYQCVSNPACQWESLPSPSPITDQSISCNSDSDCIVGTCDKLNKTCNIKTVGLITDGNEFKGDKYRFTFKADDYKPQKWFFQRQMEVQESTTDKNKCIDIDCSIAFANNNRSSAPVLKDGICSAKQNIDNFNTTNKKCPFKDTTRCCNKSDTNTEFSGQICAADKVGAINKDIVTSRNGYLSECVDNTDCVDSNGEVCGGNGYCQYDDINGGGKCVCDLTYNGDKCQIVNPCSTKLDNVYVVPFCVCGNTNGQYDQTPSLLYATDGTTPEPVKFNDTKLSINYYEVARNTNDGKHGLEILMTLLNNLNSNKYNARFTFEVVNDGQIYVITNQDESQVLYGDKESVFWRYRPASWGTNWYDYTGNRSSNGTSNNYNRWDKLGDPGIQNRCCWTIIRATDKQTKKIYCSLMNVAGWFIDLDYWYGDVVEPPGNRTCWTFEDDCKDTAGDNGDRSFRGFNTNDQYFLYINSDNDLQLSSIYGGNDYVYGSNILMFSSK
jgi:hypothetical protein